MSVGPDEFDISWFNGSPLRGEKPDFWPVSKFNTTVLLVNLIPAVSR